MEPLDWPRWPRPRLRLGMVGGGLAGNIGRTHRTAALMDSRWDLVAGALSRDPDRARESDALWQIAPDRAYGSAGEMAVAEAARPDGIHAVAICTPNVDHHPSAMAFLEAGIHVICDKPLTTTPALAEELVATARERNGLGDRSWPAECGPPSLLMPQSPIRRRPGGQRSAPCERREVRGSD